MESAEVSTSINHRSGVYTLMQSRKKQKQTSSSRGKSKQPKRILEGRRNKSKHARLQCKECGGWFESLGQVNQHYNAAGHKKKRKPPKKIRFAKDYTQSELELTEALIELLKDPVEFRRKVREKIIESARRKGGYGFG